MFNPLSQDNLTNLFRISPKNPDLIINREGRTLEFKESYNWNNRIQYIKIMASFANNKGGYIIFGIGNKPRKLIGLKDKSISQFESLKTEEFTQLLNNYFSKEISWDHCTFELNNMKFGVIYVYQLEYKPCICKKNSDSVDEKSLLKEGDIYYRYVGRSERIRYAELNSIINKTQEKEFYKWYNLFKSIARIGVENASLLDLKKGTLSGDKGTVIIDSELLKKINFIQEGKFVENGGTPTLRLIGDIKEIETGKFIVTETTKKVIRAIEPKDIIHAFLNKIKIDNPIDYITGICFTLSANYPIYYFIKQSSKNISDIIQIVEKTQTRYSTKQKLIERLEGNFIHQEEFKNSLVGEQKKKYYQQWINESIPIKIENIKYCVQTIYCLSKEEIIAHSDYICSTMLKIYNQEYTNVDRNVASCILKAICRIDECLYID